jgi:uncharacterized membrane protein
LSRAHSRGLADLEQMIGRVLRTGTVTSSVCLAAGLVMTLAGYRRGLAQPLLAAGIIILLATPVARVVVSVVGYFHERDWTFMTLTFIVLLALAGSVVAAFWY